MKNLLLFLLLLPAFAIAQYDSTKVRTVVSGYGFTWKNGKFPNSLIVPVDTIKMAVADSGAITFFRHNLYTWSGYVWQLASGGASKADQNALVDTAAAIRAAFPVGGSTDTSHLSDRINLKANQQALIDTAAHIRADFPTTVTETDPLFDTKFAAKSTSDLTEGTNLYYTTARARAALSALSPLAYNNVTGAFSISQSNTSTDGYLSSTDWNTFNGKVNPPDTSNKWVNNVTKINDSTIRVFKGAGSNDLLIRGNGSGGGGIAMVKQILASGSAVTVNNASTWLIDKSASNVTITLAASPADGQRVDISFKLAVTSVIVSPNSGQTIKDANGVTSVEAGESIAYQYDSTDLIWYRL